MEIISLLKMKKITLNCYSSDSRNVKQLILLIYCPYTTGKNIIVCQLCRASSEMKTKGDPKGRFPLGGILRAE